MMVGIDSMVLIYAQRVPVRSGGQLTPEEHTIRENLGLRAKILLHELVQDKRTVVLPTIAIAELLVPVPDVQRGTLAAALSRQFHCPTFDLRSAAIAADLWARFKVLPPEQRHADRNVLKADAMVVASAFAAGARIFYSHDRQCRTMAGLIMEARDLPTHARDLFLAEEIRQGLA